MAPSLRHLLSLPRFLRPALCLLSLLSLTLCLTLGGLWVRSGWRFDRLDQGHIEAYSVSGKVFFRTHTHESRWNHSTYPPDESIDFVLTDGKAFGTLRVYGETRAWFPLWLPMTLTAILPGLWVYRSLTKGGREVGRGFPLGEIRQ